MLGYPGAFQPPSHKPIELISLVNIVAHASLGAGRPQGNFGTVIVRYEHAVRRQGHANVVSFRAGISQQVA